MTTTATLTPSTLHRLRTAAQDIKLSHSIFALPFALLAAFLAAAAAGQLPDIVAIILIVVCMVLGRTVAMATNRWADAGLDAKNPRTAKRAIPSGRLSAPFMLGVAICGAATFVVATSGFWLLSNNPWPVVLSPLVLAWLVGYSFTKRFTFLCHLFLGFALALSPLAAAIAINPAFLSQADPYMLALMVACWVAGFDVIYALQDTHVDRVTDVHSMPARLGARRALVVGAVLHSISAAALVAMVAISSQLRWAFATGTGLVILLLLVQHTLVWTTGRRHIQMAFFTLNGVISLVLGALGIADVVWRVGG